MLMLTSSICRPFVDTVDLTAIGSDSEDEDAGINPTQVLQQWHARKLPDNPETALNNFKQIAPKPNVTPAKENLNSSNLFAPSASSSVNRNASNNIQPKEPGRDNGATGLQDGLKGKLVPVPRQSPAIAPQDGNSALVNPSHQNSRSANSPANASRQSMTGLLSSKITNLRFTQPLTKPPQAVKRTSSGELKRSTLISTSATSAAPSHTRNRVHGPAPTHRYLPINRHEITARKRSHDETISSSTPVEGASAGNTITAPVARPPSLTVPALPQSAPTQAVQAPQQLQSMSSVASSAVGQASPRSRPVPTLHFPSAFVNQVAHLSSLAQPKPVTQQGRRDVASQRSHQQWQPRPLPTTSPTVFAPPVPQQSSVQRPESPATQQPMRLQSQTPSTIFSGQQSTIADSKQDPSSSTAGFGSFLLESKRFRARLTKSRETEKTRDLLVRFEKASANFAFGRGYSQEEDELIVHLKEDLNLGWNDIYNYFPHRTAWNVLQTRYSKKLKSKNFSPISDSFPHAPTMPSRLRQSVRAADAESGKYRITFPNIDSDEESGDIGLAPDAQVGQRISSRASPVDGSLEDVDTASRRRRPRRADPHTLDLALTRDGTAVSSLSPKIRRSPVRGSRSEKRLSLHIQRPYLCRQERQFLQDSFDHDLWDVDESLQWEGTTLHVDFNSLELDISTLR